MSEDIFIACRGVSIGYQERASATIVVKNDITVHALGGEMVALIGGNGIGKSTLLKTIAGFQSALSGELLIHGRPVAEYTASELALEMSFVSTEIVRVANLTVRDMVGLGRFPYTNWFGQLNDNDQKIIERAIHQVGLSGYEDRLVNRISDGERQRTMIARALAQDTKIMVLDEPTAYLDISNKYEIVRILHQLANDEGKCIIFSTHDLNTALTMADRIWLMLDKEVVQGIPEEVACGGYLDALFPNNHHLQFDTEKGDFRIKRESKGGAELSASGPELILAQKALERLGFEVLLSPSPSPLVHSPSPSLPVPQSFPRPLVPSSSSSSSPSLPVPQSPSLPLVPSPPRPLITQSAKGWIIAYNDATMEVETMEQLCRAMKSLKLRPEF
ncbi:MAG: ABC transporter ATP-binding protein [Prolixibacteraceae bacterium]